MKVNLTQLIKDVNGEDAKDKYYDVNERGDTFLKEEKVLTLGYVIRIALNNMKIDSDAEELYKRGELATKIRDNEADIDLKEADRLLIKKMVAAHKVPALYYYQICQALEGE